ncbi:MAG: serine hydrolase domain-containing protein [Candidatus Binatus sp.]|uniref:serine hydrolase domain-containing protein n=1 Tax=Candidatus Binatus sp. TaxID=2811406 RepID=UPI003C73D427
MPAQSHFADSPREVGLDPEKVEALFNRAEREVKDGLLPSTQIAIARNGKIGAMRTVGRAVQGGSEKRATNDTLYTIFSCTKAIMSAASWILIGEGKLNPGERVAEIIPEFGANGKDTMTVEQVLLHVGGFPNAPYPQSEWLDKSKRLERFAKWRLEWPVGSKFQYHPSSGFWVIAEIIERRTGKDFRQFVRERIATPLGLPELRVGLPREYHHRVAQLCYVGEALSDEERNKLRLPAIPETEVTEEAVLGFNRPNVMEAGVPGGGGIMTAGDLALFYQGLLYNRGIDGAPIIKPEALKDALRVRSGDYKDPIFGVKCNRALGVIVAGGDGLANYRGFGKTNSALAFGHGGAGGQIGWADPATGISIGYTTNGFDRNDLRQARRGVAISSLAAVCAG